MVAVTKQPESYSLKILWFSFWCSLVNCQVAKFRLGHLLTRARMLWVISVISFKKTFEFFVNFLSSSSSLNSDSWYSPKKCYYWVSLCVDKLHLSLNGILFTPFHHILIFGWLYVRWVNLLLSASRIPVQIPILSIWSATVWPLQGSWAEDISYAIPANKS